MAKKQKKQAKKESTKVVKEAEKKTEPKKPGILDTIQACVQHGPVSKEQILSKLVKRFPDHSEEGMAKTIDAQLPSRMAKERGIKIVVKDGKYSIKS